MRTLSGLYELERVRLRALAGIDGPCGAYDAPVFGQGPEKPFLMLIGEAPGGEETKQLRPFVGKAGRQLDELLTLAGIPREEVFITNVVKYRPMVIGERTVRNRTPVREEIDASLPLLREELGILQPRCVATLGNVPLSAVLSLCGLSRRVIGEVHGQSLRIALQDWETALFPLYHPASAIYNRTLLPVCREDAERLGEFYAVNKR